MPDDEELPAPDWYLDPALVDGFVAGKLDEHGEAFLAGEIAKVLPFHAELPHPLAAQLTRIADALGGEPAVWAWLDRFPGRPRAIARLYAAQGLLDRVGAEPAVVTALAEYRTHTPFPPGLENHLVPVTSVETLPSLSGEIELLLRRDQVDEAVRVALAATELLARLAPRVAELEPALAGLGSEVEQTRKDLLAVVPETSGG
jgi:hypothetical protein